MGLHHLVLGFYQVFLLQLGVAPDNALGRVSFLLGLCFHLTNNLLPALICLGIPASLLIWQESANMDLHLMHLGFAQVNVAPTNHQHNPLSLD